MKTRHVLWLLLLLPLLCFGQDGTQTASALSFNPPPTDLSTNILSNIFGVVGNVLHGSGSQIMGEMFRVFNAAVLTIGGILLFYILIVSTLNTSAEGEFLGRKWKSIWIPIRAVLGIILLVPQSSGYCLAQVFVMWLVMQGVGAGDLIWNTSLDYLSRGGVISAPNLFVPTTDQTQGSGYLGTLFGPSQAAWNVVSNVSGQMLENTVCTQFLQKGAETARQIIINAGGKDPGDVPDLMSSISFTATEAAAIASKDTGPRTVSFPNTEFWGIPSTKGFCGSVSWAAVDLSSVTGATSQGLSDAQLTRAQGLQSVLDSLTTTGSIIVNDALSPNPQPLGRWDGKNWISGTPNLTGYEIDTAVSNFMSVMRPTYNLLQRGVTQTLDFINAAKQDGWIMAGSYFNDVAQTQRQQAAIQSEAGKITVGSPVFGNIIQNMATFLPQGMSSDVIATRDPLLTTYLKLTSSKDNMDYTAACKDLSTPDQQLNCYIVSAKNVPLPTGVSAAQTQILIPQFQIDFKALGYLDYDECSWYDVPCEVKNLAFGVANNLVIPAINAAYIGFQWVIFRPMASSFTDVFNSIYTLFNQPGNPILSLASAGNNLLNAVGALWTAGVTAAAVLGVLPGVTVGPSILAFIMPLLNVILMTIFSVAIILAYYIPLVPYITFMLASIGWIIAVIESMVAAPIVALGIAHPENHEVFGKAEQAVMLLLNIFLRPAMMIIGFVTAIILSYVSIWLLNQGFIRVTQGMLTNLSGIASLIAPLAGIAIYVVLVMAIVQKSFALIYMLPDKILRWLSGGTQASFGEETAGMVQEVKQTVSGGAERAGQAVKGAGESMERQIEKKHAEDQKGQGKPGSAGQSVGEGPGPGGGGSTQIQQAASSGEIPPEAAAL